jgi:hypothetical protein
LKIKINKTDTKLKEDIGKRKLGGREQQETTALQGAVIKGQASKVRNLRSLCGMWLKNKSRIK